MYQHFGSKDEVLVEMLKHRAPHVMAGLDTAPDAAPRDRILAVFDALHAQAQTPEFHGCPFVNVATELKDHQHPASVAALGYKLELNAFFEEQARLAGAEDPQALGVQLTMMFDGASAYSVVRGEASPAARSAVEALLAAQGRLAADDGAAGGRSASRRRPQAYARHSPRPSRRRAAS